MKPSLSTTPELESLATMKKLLLRWAAIIYLFCISFIVSNILRFNCPIPLTPALRQMKNLNRRENKEKIQQKITHQGGFMSEKVRKQFLIKKT